MKVVRNLDSKSVAPLKRFVLIKVGILFVMASLMVLPSLFIRQMEVVTIIEIDTARECRSRGTYKIWQKFRSNKTQNSSNYCGSIMSDHGSFDLPETTWLHLFGTPREALHDGLIVGCNYRIIVVGPGLALEKGRNMSNHNRTLKSAVPLGDCATLEET